MPSGSLDFVYTSHFLEHLERSEALALLRDIARVMKPHATLRIVVPDLARSVTLCQDGERRLAVDAMSSAGAGGRLAQHRYMYDEAGLRELLAEAGFRKVVRCEPGQCETPDLEIVDTRSDESLFVEAWESGSEIIRARMMNASVEARRRAFDRKHQTNASRLGPGRRVGSRRPCAAPAPCLGGHRAHCHLLSAGSGSCSGAEARRPSAESRHSRTTPAVPEPVRDADE